ncbi:aminoglycoside phosphotransferase family protein [Nocardiopsis sp. CC223A]|uniref:aminoglycoside phosphotransferase family protein n=1 Tax=Nocardiopsis sp. CC223A TaxID=3044051 RepID=UPI00278C56CD|nr:aminoglycoside phosphotransferase family protein [Nocardiopsis sp. CC223A]
MDIPEAEVDITPGLVRRLLADQHPDLSGLPLTPVANGWDNTILRLGDALAVRLPRRERAAELTRNEQRWLGKIAARLDTPVPAPVRVGRPGRGYPWHWSVVPWFEGRTAAEVPVAERSVLAVPLADFAVRLHVPAPADAPANSFRGVPLAARAEGFHRRLEAVPHLSRRRRLAGLWDGLAAAPAWPGPPLWLHGDLHPANLLVSPAGPGPAAVLDFGDLTAGDPATDLAVAWMLFGPADRAAFRARVDAAGTVDPHVWDRARAWALLFGVLLAAHSDDARTLAEIGAHTLGQVVLAEGTAEVDHG